MPRPEAPIATVGPIAAFAQRLRDVRAASGLTYAKMAVEARYAAGTLAAAARGEIMPTWPLAQGYLKVCGVIDPDEVRHWERDWKNASEAAEIIPASKRLTAEEMPDPRQVRTYRDLLDQLGILKIAAGDLPYRCFYFGKANPKTRGVTPLPASTVSDLFTGKHVGRYEVFALVVRGLVKQAISWYGKPHARDDLAWHDLAAWHLAWRRARAYLVRQRQIADRAQEPADGKQVDLAGLVTWLAYDMPDVAALALNHLEPHRREQILESLPLDIAQAVHRSKPPVPRAP